MKKILSNQFTKGMNWDTLPDLVPNNQYEYALNAVVTDIEGHEGALVSEHSNYACAVLPGGYKVIGSVHAPTTENPHDYLIALSNEENSILAIHNIAKCKYTELVSSNCLNFSERNPINILIKIKDNGNRIAYITDSVNDYRVVNIDNLSDYYENNVFSCNKIKFSPEIEKPDFYVKEILEGGEIKLGSYIGYIRYVNSDLSETNIIAQSESICISNQESKDFFLIGGGYNLGTTSSSTNEEYLSSDKSIVFKAENLSSNFKYIKIEIAGKIGGTGAYDLFEKSDLILINNGEATWTYTGLNTEPTNLENITIDNVTLLKVGAHTQKENRLFVANTLEEYDLSYEQIQQAALNIPIKWTSQAKPKFYVEQGNPKSLTYYTSLMRDEIYAIGIKGTTLNGRATPVFHIPGRSKIHIPENRIEQTWIYNTKTLDPGGFWDERLLNITSTDNDTQNTFSVNPFEVEHLQQYIQNPTTFPSIEQWRVFNTSYIDEYNPSEDIFKGQMGYHENESNYPSIETPNGLLYGTLSGTPIRHHRMPDTNTVIHVNNDKVYQLGIEADLTNFLNNLSQEIKDKIVSWELVVGERTEDNKTVLDKGFTTWNENKRVDNTKASRGFNFQEGGKIIGFYSPKIMFNKSALNPTHYHVEMYNSHTALIGNNATGYERQIAGAGQRDWIREFYDVIGKYDNINSGKRLSNFKVNYPTYINDTILDKEKSTWVQGNMPTVSDLEGLKNYNYTPHAWRFLTSMGKFINNPLNQTPNGLSTSYKGYITYGALKKERSVYENLSEINYIEYKGEYDTTTKKYKVKEGDTFISPFLVEISSYVDYINFTEQDQLPNVDGSTLQDPIHDVFYTWVESEINTGLRHSKNSFTGADNEMYYKGWIYSNGTAATIISPKGHPLTNGFYEHLVDMTNQVYMDLTKETMTKRLWKQAFLYNKDYNAFKSIRNYTPLSNQHNYNNPQKRNLYKIRYSEKSFQDTIYDNYRTFFPNNGTTQDAQQGEIIDLFVDKNELYSRTHKSVLFIPTNTQTVKTNEATFYLGNAQVLPYEPKALNTLSYSNGGGLLFTHKLVTEYGTVLVDLNSSRIFLLRDGLQDISDTFSNFFLSFLKSELLDFGAPSNYDKIILYYDTLHKRLLLTYKGRKIKEPFAGRLKEDLIMTYNKEADVFLLNNKNNVFEYIPPKTLSELTDPISFTVSYSFMTNSWTSFHSYMPDYAFGTNKGFIQFSNENIWAHQINDSLDEPYLNFNESRYPFIVELTINGEPTYTKILGNLNIYSDSMYWDNMYAYTSKQHTGLINLEHIKTSDDATLNQWYSNTITEYEGYFRIDRLFDLVKDINVPIWQKNNRLEKVINSSNIETGLNMYQGYLRGKWIRVRLEYNTTNTNLKKQYIWLLTSTVDLINR